MFFAMPSPGLTMTGSGSGSRSRPGVPSTPRLVGIRLDGAYWFPEHFLSTHHAHTRQVRLRDEVVYILQCVEWKYFSHCWLWWASRHSGWFNIKMPLYQHRNSHCGDKIIVLLFYVHNGNPYIGKTSLYWIRVQESWIPMNLWRAKWNMAKKKSMRKFNRKYSTAHRTCARYFAKNIAFVMISLILYEKKIKLSQCLILILTYQKDNFGTDIFMHMNFYWI